MYLKHTSVPLEFSVCVGNLYDRLSERHAEGYAVDAVRRSGASLSHRQGDATT